MFVKQQSVLLEVLGRSSQLKILDYLLDFPTNDFTKKEIIEALGMSKQTFYKYFDDLEEVGIVKVNRAIGKAKLYIVDRSSSIVKDIANMERKMSLQITENEETKLKRPIPAK